MAKALHENGSDGEERKLGEQTGLDIKNSVNFWNFTHEVRKVREILCLQIKNTVKFLNQHQIF